MYITHEKWFLQKRCFLSCYLLPLHILKKAGFFLCDLCSLLNGIRSKVNYFYLMRILIISMYCPCIFLLLQEFLVFRTSYGDIVPSLAKISIIDIPFFTQSTQQACLQLGTGSTVPGAPITRSLHAFCHVVPQVIQRA